MSLADRLATVPALAHMKTLLADVHRIEEFAEALENILNDVHAAWIAVGNRRSPESIAQEFTRNVINMDVFRRYVLACAKKEGSPERERACITCSAEAGADAFHMDDKSWPAGHVKSGLYRTEG
jgi:hypothetical protein